MKDKTAIYIKLDSIYNKAIEQYRASIDTWPADYAAHFCSEVRRISNENLQKYNDPNKVLEKIKKDPLVEFFIKNNIPFEVKVSIYGSRVNVYGEPHHYNVYAVLYVDKKYIPLYYEHINKEKKSFIFENNKLIPIEKE